jgi:hypothetical protein
MPHNSINPSRRLARNATGLAILAVLTLGWNGTHAQVVTETPEIVYSSSEAQPLRDKAAQLGTAVAIYEYLHNTIDYAPYHGSRSGSVNTFLGKRGSDVDIASSLIAMLRAQSIPARYAVGTVRMPSPQLTNWLGIGSLDAAIQVLKDQGIPGVTLASDRSTVDFEHAWAEAFVPFDQYRGIHTVTPAIDCSQVANASRCTWVPLDASFKQKTYNGLNLDPYGAVTFDYTAYYNAIKNNDAARRDKNPLAIYEEQVGQWLRTNHAGKTLEDVEDAGKIVEIREGLLPASLPYQVIGTIRRYDTVAAHDAAVPSTETKKWGKTLSMRVTYSAVFSGGGTITLSSGTPNILLAEIATKRLTFVPEFDPGDGFPSMVVRLGGVEIARPIDSRGSNGDVPLGSVVTMEITMSGAPSVVSGQPDRDISATYQGMVGGYYLIATGGESSNWTQVHRAAGELLDANDLYKIVFNPSEAGCQADGTNCTPYVDANSNGWDSTDTKLLESRPALDALTGGLLHVAATQYYAKLREQFERADRLRKVKTPVIGFLGVVSSVYEAEYINGTAFSILPGGLLIDMKGITIGGSYRSNEAALNYSSSQFEFIGHLTSSLEHEIWQELTGYDAVSTVRGIQMALANGATLLNLKKNSSTDTLPGLYPSLGFSTAVPSGFTYTPLTVYSTAPATWTHATQGKTFDTILPTVTAATSATQRRVGRFVYSATTGIYAWSDCVDYWEGQLQAFYNANGNASISPISMCNQTFSGPVLTVISQFQNYWLYTVIPYYIGQVNFDYYDRNKGFSPTGRIYRAYPQASDAYDTTTIAFFRNDLYLRDLSQSWVEYTLPSKLATGSNYRFEVDIRSEWETETGHLISMAMEIINRSISAGGGYVGLEGLKMQRDPTNSSKAVDADPDDIKDTTQGD